MSRWKVGLDVGSTTVKAVVLDWATQAIVWKHYRRHAGYQRREALGLMTAVKGSLGVARAEQLSISITGSGGAALASDLGARFVHEVSAVSAAVEKRFPQTAAVIELGGQDAKMIFLRADPTTGRKHKICTMNDKCAGGTGAVIDKLAAKLGITPEQLQTMNYRGQTLHPIAARCGVFAETDINGLQKQGVATEPLMASLFEVIVQQNLTVLARGHTLSPLVLLLGGPHTFIPGLVEAWQVNLERLWAERQVLLPRGVTVQELVFVPQDAHYFAALGAVELADEAQHTQENTQAKLALSLPYVAAREDTSRRRSAGRSLAGNADALREFLDRYQPPPISAPTFTAVSQVAAFLGIDAGSTSIKAALLSPDQEVLATSYELSAGNPIADTQRVVSRLRHTVERQGASLAILGVATTGYSKDLLRDVLRADTAIVETVAHTESARHFYKDVSVICDVGGQDIKIIILKDGRVKDFRLNTQCSAGTGYFLQSACQRFGIPIEDYARVAFSAQAYPEFSYGCAVFLQTEIVDFQRQGWTPPEILAGLAAVLPKNVWLYVAKLPNLARLGNHFVLQGGTQHNLAAVKAQIDFIQQHFQGTATPRPKLSVHRYAGESGAIGAALEALRLWDPQRPTYFIGLEALARLRYQTIRDESTRCYFCRNRCLRTFIDVTVEPERNGIVSAAATRRLISATCERGRTADIASARRIHADVEALRKANPNLAAQAARLAWRDYQPRSVARRGFRLAWLRMPYRDPRHHFRAELRIGIPRVLSLYSLAPFFTAYLTSLGVPFRNVVFSDITSEALYREGAKRGAIDPCFPSKICIAHVHNLIFRHHVRRPLDWILFPMVDSLPAALNSTQDSRACPTVTATPEVVKAAFGKERDVFADHGIRYVSPFLNFAEPRLLMRQMWYTFGPLLALSRSEHRSACAQGWQALAAFTSHLRAEGTRVLGRLTQENRLGIVLLARPYHADPGIIGEILVELQRQGFPILTVDSLPVEGDLPKALFEEDIGAGHMLDETDLSDVWTNSYSENSNRKLWAAKFVARHPRLVGLEFSSFKCGHDAPIYSVIEAIVEGGGKPFFMFRDMDETRPANAIRLRVETMTYVLQRYQAELQAAFPTVP